MIERLRILQAERGKYSNGMELSLRLSSDESLRKEVKTLSKKFLNKEVSGCGNCLADAYFELIHLSIENIMNKPECRFTLPKGKLLKDVVNQDISKYMTQANISDNLALYHLKTNPNCAKFFTKLPEDWEKQAESFDLASFGLNPPSKEEKTPSKVEKKPKSKTEKQPKKEKTTPKTEEKTPSKVETVEIKETDSQGTAE